MDILNYFVVALHVGLARKRKSILVVKSKYLIELLDCLYSNGFITSYSVGKENILVFLKYHNGQPVLTRLIRKSKRSQRIYVKKKDLWSYRGNLILLTNKGFVFYSQDLKFAEFKGGGELLFCIE